MSFVKRGYQQQNTSGMKSDCGQVEWVTGLFWVLILSIVLYTQLQIASWRTVGMYMEDALAASNLASALIDIREYGKTHEVVISDAEQAYNIYRESLRENLNLNEQWECENRALISGKVEIADYIIYNVVRDTVTASRVGQSGQVTESWGGIKGLMRAPDGNSVEHTGVYSEITFPVSGFPGIIVMAHKGKLVDVVAEGREG